jgi:hypothetical protein
MRGRRWRSFARSFGQIRWRRWRPGVALGYVLWKTGDDAGGGEAMREGLRILSEKKDMPQPVFDYARIGVMTQYAQLLNATHRKEEARQVESEMALLSDGKVRACNGCTVNVVALSNTLR